MRLKARRPSLGDRPVILVDVVERRLEDAVGPPVVPDLDQQLEDLLAVVGERPHVEVVHGQLLGRNAELCGRLANLAGEGVRREPLRQRPGRDRERDVAHLGAGVDESHHRPATPELTVVGVRREHERTADALDHAVASAGASARAPTTTSASSAQKRRVLEERVVEEAVHQDRGQG